jgi:hypothetical protein
MAQSQLFIIDGVNHKLNSYSFSTYQKTDPMTNRPMSAVGLSKISLALTLAPSQMKPFWLWAKNDKILKDGEIKSIGLEYETYSIHFKDGVCTNLNISDSVSGSDNLNIYLEIAVKCIQVDGDELIMNW